MIVSRVSDRLVGANLTTLTVTVIAALLVVRCALSDPTLTTGAEQVEGWEALAATGYRHGPENADVTVVVFIDYGCGPCADAVHDLRALRAEFPQDLRVVYHQFPFGTMKADLVERALHCGNTMGWFTDVQDFLFANYSDFVVATWDKAIGRRFADRAEPLAGCIESARPPSPSLGYSRVPLRGTPSYIVDGFLVEGYVGLREMRGFVVESLSRTNRESGINAISQFVAKLARPGPLAAQEAQVAPVLVKHTGEDTELDWTFEPQWQVGGTTDTRIGGIAFLTASHVDADSHGSRVFVLDRRRQKVLVVAEGLVVDSVGRRGEGPGEMLNPLALALTGDSVLSVFDRGRIVRWRVGEFGEWSVMDPLRLAEPFGHARGLHVYDRNAVFLGLKMLGGTRGDDDDVLVGTHHVARATETETTTLIEGSKISRAPVEFPSCGFTGTYLPKIFEPRLAWDAKGSRIVIAEDRDYVIHVFDGEDVILRIERDLSSRPVSASMARREVVARPELVTHRCSSLPAARVVDGLGFGEHLQAVSGVLMSGDGEEIWIQRGRVSDEPNNVDVFGADGEYMGTLPPDSPFPVAFLGDDVVVVLTLDALDVPVMTAFRVIRH